MARNYAGTAGFNPAMMDTHAYVGRNGNGVEGARSYLHKGTGHMVYTPQWEPQRTNNFEVVIENLDVLNPASVPDNAMSHSATSQPYLDHTIMPPNAAERIMLSVDSFSAPTVEIAQITTQYGNNSIKWAGKPEFQNSTLTINDYIGIQTERILAAWFRCAYDFKSEKIGLARDYKKTGFLIEYDPKGGSARVWRLDGLWLANFNLGDWSQDGNNQRKIQATLVYDRVVPDYGLDDEGGGGYGDWRYSTQQKTTSTHVAGSAVRDGFNSNSSGYEPTYNP